MLSKDWFVASWLLSNCKTCTRWNNSNNGKVNQTICPKAALHKHCQPCNIKTMLQGNTNKTSCVPEPKQWLTLLSLLLKPLMCWKHKMHTWWAVLLLSGVGWCWSSSQCVGVVVLSFVLRQLLLQRYALAGVPIRVLVPIIHTNKVSYLL